MENSNQKNILRFLSEQEKLTEHRLHELNIILENDLRCPDHILDTLQQLRQNAEDDLSNILHLQSIYPGRSGRSVTVLSPSRRALVVTRPGSDLGDLDEDASTGQQDVLAEDDMFALDGVGAALPSHSDEERDDHDSEADEGIHIPSKFRHRNGKPLEVAASLPVGIPWPAQMTAGAAAAAGDRQQLRQLTGDNEEEDVRPTDIAASIQALAASVHTSSIFGDNVFGDLPRPRTNTYGKKTDK